MINQTEAVTVDLVRLALDAASMRQQAIANNIANANTPGYMPARVSFESQLDAVRRTLRDNGRLSADMLSGLRPVVEREQAAGSQGVAIDMEAVKMSENATHYQALLKALNKHFSIMGTAVNNGKR
ncbi:MAG TPA: flagellar basal body rod protein FlgB [Paucimonas sp.]|nr:flagellar basal body rod protein FlgB [Paucimonas sp.]